VFQIVELVRNIAVTAWWQSSTTRASDAPQGRDRLSSIAQWHFRRVGPGRNAMGGARTGNGTLWDRLRIRSRNGACLIRVRIPTLTWKAIGGLGLYIASGRWLLGILPKRNSAYH
jgi:hypothetical protein